jgi:dynein heavy chain
LKDIAAAVRFFKDKELPKIYKNASFMKEKIDEFKPKVPLALSLRKEGMQDRHWD